jgi:hypothetical protein
MTLTDIIAKITLFAKRAIVNDNSSSPAVTVNQSGSGDAMRITQTGSGNALVVEDSASPDTTPFIVKSDGLVGIGTTTPASKLHISQSGNAEARITSSTSQGPGLSLDRPAGRSYRIQNDLGVLTVRQGSPGIQNATSTAMQYNPTGGTLRVLGVDFGIDTAAGLGPLSKLHVNGDITVTNSTTATAATAGTSGSAPAQVAGYLVVSINNVSRKIPYYAT